MQVSTDTPASTAAKGIQIYSALEWLFFAWEQVSSDNIQKCFNKVGFKQFHNQAQHPDNESSDPALDEDVTPGMQELIDIPFREFVDLESDNIIHPTIVEATPVPDEDIVEEDYQPDPESQKVSLTNTEVLQALEFLKSKAAGWNNEHILQLAGKLEAEYLVETMKAENGKKQTSIKDFFHKA